MSLGPKAIEPIIWATLAASMDRDADRLAEVTKPLFFDGDAADQYAFLSALLEVIKVTSPIGLKPDEFMGLRIEPGASQAAVAFGRLLAAHFNNDSDTCLALWATAGRDDAVAGGVLSLAIVEAGKSLVRKKAADL